MGSIREAVANHNGYEAENQGNVGVNKNRIEAIEKDLTDEAINERKYTEKAGSRRGRQRRRRESSLKRQTWPRWLRK